MSMKKNKFFFNLFGIAVVAFWLVMIGLMCSGCPRIAVRGRLLRACPGLDPGSGMTIKGLFTKTSIVKFLLNELIPYFLNLL